MAGNSATRSQPHGEIQFHLTYMTNSSIVLRVFGPIVVSLCVLAGLFLPRFRLGSTNAIPCRGLDDFTQRARQEEY